jgi:hypothetical protein
MDKKKLARLEMLKKMSKDKSGEMYSPVGDKLKEKKLSKVTVIAPDKKGLEKGLSKAQQILKAKLGEKLGLEDGEEETEEECPACDGEGCEECEAEEESDEE